MMSLHSALRAQLGVAVPAMSIAKEGSLDPEPCLLFFGIVDFLQVHAPGPPDADVVVFCWMCCSAYHHSCLLHGGCFAHGLCHCACMVRKSGGS